MFDMDRSALTLFGFEIRWYGILIALGILGAVLIASRREERLGLKKDTALDLGLICVPAGVICARLYYVLFSWEYYAAHLREILDLRGGGIAIYGAVIGGALAVVIYCKKKKIPFGVIADLIAPGLALGQAIGRWGNFLNGEAYGAAVLNPALQFFPLSVYIEGSGWHYAAFFYESIWCALICAFLLIGERKGFFRRKGDVFLGYLFLYALERSIVEGLRTDSLYLGPLRVSQLLSLCAMLVILLILLRRAGGKGQILLSLALLIALGVCLALDAPAWALLPAAALLANTTVLYWKNA